MRKIFTILLVMLISITSWGQSLPMVINNSPQSTNQPLLVRSTLNSIANPLGTIPINGQVVVSQYQTASSPVTSQVNGSTTNTFGEVASMPGATGPKQSFLAVGASFSNPVCSWQIYTCTTAQLTVRVGAGVSNAIVTFGGSNVYLWNGQKVVIVETQVVSGGSTWGKFILASNYSTGYGGYGWVNLGYMTSSYTGSTGLFTPILNLVSHTANSVSFQWDMTAQPNGQNICTHNIFISINGAGYTPFATRNVAYPNNNSITVPYNFSGGTYSFYMTSNYPFSGCSSGQSNSVSFTTSSPCVPTSSVTNLTICNNQLPYSWNGLTFSGSGTQTAHLTNSCGMDSAATLNLGIDQVVNGTNWIVGNNSITPPATSVQYVANGYASNVSSYAWTYNNGSVQNIVQYGGNACWIDYDANSTAGDLCVTLTTYNGCTSTPACTHINIGTLPVKFTSFTTKANCGSVLVKWTTANEVNNKEFVIQKSVDGSSFIDVKTIQPNTYNSYSFTQNDVENGAYYYRIKQIDFNGKFLYSNVNKVVVNCFSNDLKVYPNPAITNLFVVLPLNEKGKLHILDIGGKLLLKKDVFANRIIEFDVSSLIAGTYLLEFITTKNVIHKAKFLKL